MEVLQRQSYEFRNFRNYRTERAEKDTAGSFRRVANDLKNPVVSIL
jgi:hypothetical protein